MFRKCAITVILLALVVSAIFSGATKVQGATLNLTQYVNPFLGSDDTTTRTGFSMGDQGELEPSAQVPFGMIQFGADTSTDDFRAYRYGDTQITGFSMRHNSGWQPRMMSLAPFVGSISVSPSSSPSTYYQSYSHNNETASPGYYKVTSNSGIAVELTAAKRTGIGEFTFPPSTSSQILIKNVTSLTIDTVNNKITTVANYRDGNITFVAQFDRPFTNGYGTWSGATLTAWGTSVSGSMGSIGGWITFDTTSTPLVQVKVAASGVSAANASSNMSSEIPAWDFATVKSNANTAWNNRLNAIQATGGSATDTTIFYSALYDAFKTPNTWSDANGQYMGWDNVVHSTAAGHTEYTTQSGWDPCRAGLYSLFAVLYPADANDGLQSLLDAQAQGNQGTFRQGTFVNGWADYNDSDHWGQCISSAYAFGATGFNTSQMLTALIKDASVSRKKDYLATGYVTYTSDTWSGSVQLGYVNSDFAIAQYAQQLGDTGTYNILLQHSDNWQNLWNTAEGSIWPRNTDGSWSYSNYYNGTTITKTSCDHGGWDEGNAEQHTWWVPFNLNGLIASMGGNSAAITRLDSFFTALNAGCDHAQMYMGNEPGFGVPWVYNWAGAPAKTQDTIRRLQDTTFLNTPGGYPGNDDWGAMSAWYVWSAIGMFPNIPGIAGLSVNTPRFPSIAITLGNGNTVQVNAPNVSATNRYIQSATLNGAAYNSPWLWYSAISSGGTLNFTVGSAASSWGATPPANVAPPSYPNSGTLVNDTAAGITYTGSWSPSTGRTLGDYQNDVHYSQTNNDSIQYTFTGTGIDFITEKNSDEGNVDVYFCDGTGCTPTFQTTVSSLSSTRLVQQVTWTRSGLSSGSHTIKLVKKDGSYMLVDGFKVYNTPAPGAMLNDTGAGITYTGSWSPSSGRNLGDYQNDVHYSQTNNDSIQYTFTGTGIDYITEKNSDQGSVDVYFCDGAGCTPTLQTPVNCANPTRLVQQVVWSRTGLASGSHTIKLVKTSGSFAVLDAFKVYP